MKTGKYSYIVELEDGSKHTVSASTPSNAMMKVLEMTGRCYRVVRVT